MTKKIIYVAACAALLIFTSGCANGPIRNFFRGGPCNTCQPPVGQPMSCGTNVAPGCASGVCGTGVASPLSQPVLSSPFVNSPNFAPQETSETYYQDPIFGQAPISETDSFGRIPDSANVYGTDLGAPVVGPSQGSGSR